MRTYAKYLSFAVMCIALQGDASSADVPKAAPAVAKTFASPDGRSTYTRTGVRRRVNATIAKLKPLHQKIRKAKPGKWLAEHKEAGQTFYQYLQSRPAAPIGRRTVIYVQPLGLFTKQQRQIVELAAEYLGIYMNRSVKILEDLPLSVVPQKARRIHPEWKMKQILSTYVLHSVLKPRLPKDAAAYIAFTATVGISCSDRRRFVIGSVSGPSTATATPRPTTRPSGFAYAGRSKSPHTKRATCSPSRIAPLTNATCAARTTSKNPTVNHSTSARNATQKSPGPPPPTRSRDTNGWPSFVRSTN